MLDIESYLLGKKAGGGGGGNPNRTETLTGTADNIFSNISADDWNTLYTSLGNGNASVKLVLDASALGISDPIVYWLEKGINYVEGKTLYLDDADIVSGSFLEYFFNGLTPTLRSAYMYNSGSFVDIYEYAPYVPTTATIYWHPMPSGS